MKFPRAHKKKTLGLKVENIAMREMNERQRIMREREREYLNWRVLENGVSEGFCVVTERGTVK